MRILHTADWHLGRNFFNVNLIEDQAYVLDQIVRIARDERVDAVLLAGDVYDRAVPSADAVRLLDDVLARIVLDLGVTVVVISGNHDDPSRLSFGSRLMVESGLHVAGLLQPQPLHVVLRDTHGPVHVCALPYVDPPKAREVLSDGALSDNNRAFGAFIDRVRGALPPGERSILVAHAFVAGGAACDSERPLAVGGSGAVDVAHLSGFDYVALGHLHRPQASWGERIQYSGSILKYSFSEIGQTKSVNVLDLDERGAVHVERVAITPRRDVRSIEGTLDELLRLGAADPASGDYIQAVLLDRGPVLDAMSRLQSVYPNALNIVRPQSATPADAGRPSTADHRRLSETELFAQFYEAMTGERIAEMEAEAFAAVVADVRGEGSGDQA